MKGLMVALLLFTCTGMVFAQQDFNSGARTSGSSSSSLNNQDPPMVPIVSGGDSSAPAILSERAPSERTRSAFPDSASRATQSRRPQDRSRQPLEPSQGSFQSGSSSSPSSGSSISSFDRSRSRSAESAWSNPTPVAKRSFPARDTGLTQGLDRSPTSRTSDDKVIYLGLPAAQLLDLQRIGMVEAEVKNPYVDRITISDQDRPKATPIRQIEPVLQGDKLVFRFDEEQISHMADYAFEFTVPEYMKGKYTKAVIEYPPALQRVSQTRSPNSGTNFQSEDRRWRLAGDSTPTTVDPIEAERQRQRELLNRQYEIDRQRTEYERTQRENETRRLRELAEQNRLLELRQRDDQLARSRYEQEQAALRARQGLPSTTLNPVTSTWPLTTDRYADRSFAVTSPVQPPRNTQSNDSLAVSLMQNTLQRMENRVAQLDSDNRRLVGEVNAVKGENNEMRRRFDYGDTGYRRDLTEQQPMRPAGLETNPAPQLPKRPVMSTGGFDTDRDRRQHGIVSADKDTAQSNRKRGSWDLLMFLMLLMSVGLNLYLWALSRGFYMRYQELADELRETFAVTT